MQDSEGKERQNRATNIIIKGVKDYGKNEYTLDLARDLLKDKLLWQGQIYQAWRVSLMGEGQAHKSHYSELA